MQECKEKRRTMKEKKDCDGEKIWKSENENKYDKRIVYLTFILLFYRNEWTLIFSSLSFFLVYYNIFTCVFCTWSCINLCTYLCYRQTLFSTYLLVIFFLFWRCRSHQEWLLSLMHGFGSFHNPNHYWNTKSNSRTAALLIHKTYLLISLKTIVLCNALPIRSALTQIPHVTSTYSLAQTFSSGSKILRTFLILLIFLLTHTNT